MIKNTPSGPGNEQDRLKALYSYQILDTFREEEYDNLTKLASTICGVPISLVTLLDAKRQWIKSSYGMDVTETPIEEAICKTTILEHKLLEVEDTRLDDRFADLPAVTGPDNIRFYAGYPLVDQDGFAIGAICVLDRKPHRLTERQRESLHLLADIVVSLIQDRRKNKELSHFEQLFSLSNDLICVAGQDGYFKRVNPAFERVLGWTAEELTTRPYTDFVHPDDVDDSMAEMDRFRQGGRHKVNFYRRYRTKDGDYRLLQWVANQSEAGDYIFAIARDVTEESENERLLMESQTKLSLFFEHSQGLMCTHDLEGRFLSVNTTGASLLGYEVPELEGGMGLYDIIPPSHVPAFYTYLDEIRTKGRASGQMTTIAKDGSRRIWFYNNVLETSSQDEPYVIANAIDITERYQLERALEQTKEMLEQTNQVARVGGWVIDTSRDKVFWTEMTKALHGVSSDYEPTLSQALNFFKKGTSYNEVARAVNRAMREGTSWDLEVQIVDTAGQEKWVRTLGHAEFEDGVCKRLYGAFQDIDLRKKSELEIVNSRKLLNDVLQSASEVSIIATDPNGIITVFNTGAERMLGYSAAEMIGKQTPLLIHDKEEVKKRRDELSAETGLPLEAGDTFTYNPLKFGSEQREWTFVKKDGTRCAVSLVTTPIRDIRNDIVGFLGIATDISKRKKVEEALVAAKTQAEQMSNAKSEFLANMSHEIRTPLNGIIGFSDLVLKTKLDELQQQYLSIVNQSARVLLSIINDILDLSKIEAGKLELNNERMDLFELGSEAVNIVIYQAQQKGLGVKLTITDTLPRFFMADSLRLKQVLVNLLGNAVKFTDKGEVELKITPVTDCGDDCITVRFEVRDTGIGIHPDKQSRIFEAFAQEDAATAKRYGGTGIGLTISNKILALMGSKLELNSRPGKGSTFYFYVSLPVDHTQAGAMPSMESVYADEKALNLGQVQAEVLVVEDNAVNMMLTQVLLRKLMPQSRVVEASSGTDAVEACRRHLPDIVFMDIQIPGLNGYEATAAIRAIEDGRHTPIIALTAGSISGELERCLEAGMDDYLSKPIMEDSLAAILAKWLEAGNANPTDGHFDSSVLKTFLGSDTVDAEILEITLLELQRSAGVLREVVGRNDRAGIKALGHKLYGTASATGLTGLSVLARRLDKLEDSEDIAALSRETAEEIALLEGLLEKEIAAARGA
ncbi:PAS domain S-box protein [Chitinophaga lutea]